MYELTAVAAIFVAVHVGVFFVASEVLHLDAVQFAIAVFGAAIISAIVARFAVPDWKMFVERVMNEEKRDGDVVSDIIGVVVVILAGAIAQNVLIVRRYGVRRWAGIMLVNAIVSAFV
jgi:hypothetical protein